MLLEGKKNKNSDINLFYLPYKTDHKEIIGTFHQVCNAMFYGAFKVNPVANVSTVHISCLCADFHQ